MKVLYVSSTLHNGLQERWAQITEKHSEHEARVLAPGTWIDRSLFTKDRKSEGAVYSILDRETVNELSVFLVL